MFAFKTFSRGLCSLSMLLLWFGAMANVKANETPVPDAGEDQKLTLTGPGATVEAVLSGRVTDDGQGPFTFFWFVASGPDSVEFSDQFGTYTTATFRRPGTYVIQLRVADGELEGTDQLTVQVGPSMVAQVVGKAVFLAAGSGIPRSKLIFTMSGLNAGDDKMDLRVNDRFSMTFGDVQIGSLAGAPPGSDFVRMDVGSKPLGTAVGGEPFDSGNARFAMVKARYRAHGPGFLTVVASGGHFDPALLPQPGADGTGTGTIVVVVRVERQESGETIEILFHHELAMRVKRVRDGTKGQISR